MSHDEPQEHHHPAAAYYAPATGVAGRAKDLTALGVLAFVTAAIATVSTCVVALVLPRAARIRAGWGPDAVDWSLGVYSPPPLLALVASGGGFRHRLDVAVPRAQERRGPGARGRHTRRAGWAWGGWVTPIVALWFPFQVVRDVRRALSPMETSALIGFWWALFLASRSVSGSSARAPG